MNPSIATTAGRIEVLAVHEVAGSGRSMALHGEGVPFALLQAPHEFIE